MGKLAAPLPQPNADGSFTLIAPTGRAARAIARLPQPRVNHVHPSRPPEAAQVPPVDQG
jgi:hypothetical protein